MDKNMLYPLISVIVVIVVAAGIYMAAQALGGTGPHGGGESGHGINATELLFRANDKYVGLSEYTYSYREEYENNYWIEATISKKGDLYYVHKKDAVTDRSGYFEGNETIVCIGQNGQYTCSLINGTSRFAAYADSLRKLRITDDSARAASESARKLVAYGALVFEGEPVEKTVGGKKCEEIRYHLDYSGLTVAQLNELGMATDDPMVLRSKQYNFSICIDPETGDIYEKSLEFINLGKYNYVHSTTKLMDWGTGLDVQKPTNLSSESQLYSAYSRAAEEAQAYLACLSSNESGRCIAEVAITWADPNLCSLAGPESDFCYINSGLEADDMSVCEKVGAGARDTCYIEFSNKRKEREICQRIADSALREQCLALNFGGTGECGSDSDCVRAGCSSQLCVPASRAGDITTTCEYLPEYACFAQTTCGCVNGRCSWRETPDYLNCLNMTRS